MNDPIQLIIPPLDELKPVEKKEKINESMRKELRKEFPADAYDELNYGPRLTTIKAAYIFERLNDVFGIGRWDFETEIYKDDGKVVIMVGELKLLDYDAVVPKQFGGDKYSATEPAKAFKSAVTGALSKCASYLEIGIDVFKGEIGKGGVKKKKTTTAPTTPDYITQLKTHMIKLMPELKSLPQEEAERKALQTLDLRTGLKIQSFKTMTQKQAQMALGALLSPKNH